MRLKEIRGLPVVDPLAARKIGTVSEYLVDPATGRLAAVEVQAREGNTDERIPAHRIRRIGQHAVVLTGRASSGASASGDGQHERWLDSASLANLEVLGDDGNRIGRLTDASFDQDTLEIEAYLLHANLWERLFGRHRGRIQPNQVASCSRELMIVTSGRLGEGQAIPPAEDGASATPAEPTDPLGVPLKLEDRASARAKKPAADGQAVVSVGRKD
jgi:sporulation protein YlmC with PRC-barrel domain